MDYLIVAVIAIFFIMLISSIAIISWLKEIVKGQKEIILELNRVNSAIMEGNSNK